jgi:hypothetical protein
MFVTERIIYAEKYCKMTLDLVLDAWDGYVHYGLEAANREKGGQLSVSQHPKLVSQHTIMKMRISQALMWLLSTNRFNDCGISDIVPL